jgi:hypothetical protein
MTDIRWEGLTHAEIYARVQQGPGPSASAGAEAAWSTVESTIRAVDEQLSRAVAKIGVEWQGVAADNVLGGMTVMSNWALDAAGDALLTRNGITAQAEAAGHVRAAMPQPRTDEWNEAIGQALTGVGYIPGVTDIGALEDSMAEDRALAVDLMNRYTSASSTNQQMMNYWTPPPSVVVETVTPASAPRGANRTTGRPTSAAPVAGDGSDQTGRHEQAPGVIPAGADFVPGAAGGQRGSPPDGGPRAPAAVVPSGGVRQVVPGPPQPSADPGYANGRGTARGSPTALDPLPGNPRRSAGGFTPGRPVDPVPRIGEPAEPVPRTGGAPVEAPGRGISEPGPTSPRGATGPGHGLLPVGGTGTRPAYQDHRRADYLVDDTDAFADDRWFTPAVISGDDEIEFARA